MQTIGRDHAFSNVGTEQRKRNEIVVKGCYFSSQGETCIKQSKLRQEWTKRLKEEINFTSVKGWVQILRFQGGSLWENDIL